MQEDCIYIGGPTLLVESYDNESDDPVTISVVSLDWEIHGENAVAGNDEVVGSITIEVINGNVVITVEREDEALFGPVSVVVV